MMMRQLFWIDRFITHFDKKWIRLPSSNHTKETTERQLSLGLMRVNHSGEIAAQALYHGQALVTPNLALENKLKQAAEEEQRHLEWCAKRIEDLGGRPSLFTAVWSVGSFVIGMMAGCMGDKFSLGFVAETEQQVTAHLDHHLNLLPQDDIESRDILLKMREDEAKHATHAIEAGGIKLPWVVRIAMTFTAKIMTTTSRYI